MEATSESRVRINVSIGAKGTAQFDITSEYPNETEAALHLDAAIDRTKALIAAKGFKLAGAE
jgi:hypothetical protein